MVIKLSVIIPVYNRENCLAQCLDSVIIQTIKEMEIICVNDGSTDGTENVLCKYTKMDTRIRVINQNRLGPGVARNTGIVNARGDYIAFLDSDDYYPNNDVLENLYAAAILNNADMAGGGMLREVNGFIYPRRDLCFKQDRLLGVGEYIERKGFTRFLFRRKFLIDNEIIFPNYTLNEDHPFMLKAVLYAHSFWVTEKKVYVYREYDKKKNIESELVLGDVLAGYKDLLELAVEHGISSLQKEIVEEMNDRWGVLISWFIYNGSEVVRNRMWDVKQIAVKKDIYKLMDTFWDDDNIVHRIEMQLKKEECYIREIAKFNTIIIYGSGNMGKMIYDFLVNSGFYKDIFFAITSNKPFGTSRGINVKSIYDYVDYTDSSLVLIGNKKNGDEMVKNALSIGFKNVMKIDQKIYGLNNLKMSTGEYAY